MATKSEIERLSVVETKVDSVLARLDKMDSKLDDLDKKFSAKWVEWVIKGLIAFVLLWFLGQLAGLINTSPTQVIKNVTNSTTQNPQTPSASAATPSAQSTNPASQPSNNGGVQVTLPKVP